MACPLRTRSGGGPSRAAIRVTAGGHRAATQCYLVAGRSVRSATPGGDVGNLWPLKNNLESMSKFVIGSGPTFFLQR